MCILECSDNHDKNAICFDPSPARWGYRWRVWWWFVFFLEKINTKENPFLFVTTPATNISWILSAYFYGIHDAPQRFTICQLSEFSGVEPSRLNCAARFPDDVVIKLATSSTMWYIWELRLHSFSQYELKTFYHRLQPVNNKKKKKK